MYVVLEALILCHRLTNTNLKQIVKTTANDTLDALFRAAADAAEEAVLNALCAAQPLLGYNGREYRSLPVHRVQQILRDAGRNV